LIFSVVRVFLLFLFPLYSIAHGQECPLCLVIDYSPASLDPDLMRSIRTHVIRLAPMTEKEIQSLDKLAYLFACINHVIEWEDSWPLMWRIFGGIPGHYEQIQTV
jgi:hypothetical protein